jgi:hypothetical protein
MKRRLGSRRHSTIIRRIEADAMQGGGVISRKDIVRIRTESKKKVFQISKQEQHPGLTLTGIYNVLEKLRSGEPLTAKEKLIHDQGLVTVLRQIHDELDEAVLEAYGWRDFFHMLALSHSGACRHATSLHQGDFNADKADII